MYLLFVYGCSLQKTFEAKLFLCVRLLPDDVALSEKLLKWTAATSLSYYFFSTPPAIVFHKGAKTHMKLQQNFF